MIPLDELEREIRRLQQEHLLKMYELQQNMESLRQDTIIDRTRLQLELNTQQQQAQPQSIVIHQPQCPPNIQHTHVEKGCYDHQCPPPPKPPEPPPPEPYIPLQLPPPPPIRVEEPPQRKQGGGRGGGGYSWYVEEYIPPQVIEEGAEVKIPTEGYKIERRFPSGGGPPIEIVSRGQGGPTPGPMGPTPGPIGPMGPPGPRFRLPSQIRPRPGPGNRMVSRSNDIWNRPIPGVDEGVQFDHN
ncbi:hypothetical protein LOTGIDRAFT_165674 [Lottia gigantea]|uniref:Uncharacterized protein n=1 Tax=Lottia gigantea TaxID=225164 RepID=V3ZB58_LOTGI|nr:hypothetical protein LOTGIDRAFT_165674 [Lottia gigantea]ESO88243.1 hypothetical protein LOTGIDRAFT_165674 [Lottia gigantea]